MLVTMKEHGVRLSALDVGDGDGLFFEGLRTEDLIEVMHPTKHEILGLSSTSWRKSRGDSTYLREVMLGLPGLSFLDIRGRQSLSERFALQGSTSLRTITMARCVVNWDAVNLPNLETIDMSQLNYFCGETHGALQSVLTTSPRLHTAIFNSNTILTAIRWPVCRYLRNLAMAHCFLDCEARASFLDALVSNFPALVNLDLTSTAEYHHEFTCQVLGVLASTDKVYGLSLDMRGLSWKDVGVIRGAVDRVSVQVLGCLSITADSDFGEMTNRVKIVVE